MSQVMNLIAHNYPFAFAGQRPIMDPKERFYRQFQIEVQGEYSNKRRINQDNDF